MLTREFPPEVYGGAGVHVEYLSRELAGLVDLRVHCFGKPRASRLVERAYEPWPLLMGSAPHASALAAMSVDLAMVANLGQAELVHSHTWYTNLGGHLAKLLYGIPHVATTHSLEPLRPWKAEQLGGGYQVSCFCERTGLVGADALIAVSAGMRRDVLDCYPEIDPDRVHVIHNGVDPDVYRPQPNAGTLRRYGVDPDRPYVLFLGRVTRQKGLQHLLRAALRLPPRFQLVVCAGSPDTPEIAAEVAALADRVRSERGGLVWIEAFLPREEAVHLLSGAAVFCCPSIYEPFGLVNLEAMACGAAVVASAVGGIPEIVVEGETGFLVDWDEAHPEAFESRLTARLTEVLEDPALAERLGRAGRSRVLERFTWPRIAERTVDLYRSLLGGAASL